MSKLFYLKMCWIVLISSSFIPYLYSNYPLTFACFESSLLSEFFRVIGSDADWTIFAPHLLGPIFGGSDRSASSTAEQRLLVSGVVDQHGARILVSGVEKINTSPEEGSTSRSVVCQHGTRRIDSLTNSPLA